MSCIKTGRNLRLFCPASYLINEEPEVEEEPEEIPEETTSTEANKPEKDTAKKENEKIDSSSLAMFMRSLRGFVYEDGKADIAVSFSF